MKRDEFTYQIMRALNTLFLYNVVGTSRGIVFGVFIISLQELIASLFPLFGIIKWYGFIMFGILLFNSKPFIKKTYLDPDIEKRLTYIRQMIESGGFTKAEKRAIWRREIEAISFSNNKNTDFTDKNGNSHTPTLA